MQASKRLCWHSHASGQGTAMLQLSFFRNAQSAAASNSSLLVCILLSSLLLTFWVPPNTCSTGINAKTVMIMSKSVAVSAIVDVL